MTTTITTSIHIRAHDGPPHLLFLPSPLLRLLWLYTPPQPCNVLSTATTLLSLSALFCCTLSSLCRACFTTLFRTSTYFICCYVFAIPFLLHLSHGQPQRQVSNLGLQSQGVLHLLLGETLKAMDASYPSHWHRDRCRWCGCLGSAHGCFRRCSEHRCRCGNLLGWRCDGGEDVADHLQEPHLVNCIQLQDGRIDSDG
ncbi:hypothetical protein, conserved [Leishmania tarentolae]|uniref:Uncharacterized protein n=1 Tax=Leishmania tarentolae TaxID=5689 RepID=A0A640KGF2_LEITA|nr:hypothetical protein, conserved [Leishmania tarentolae]